MPEKSYFDPVTQGLREIKSFTAEANYIADLATYVFNYSGTFTFDFKDRCATLVTALTKLQERIEGIGTLVPQPTPVFVQDTSVTDITLTQDYNIFIAASTGSVSFNFNENYIQIKGSLDGQLYESYVKEVREVTVGQTYILMMRDQPPDFTAWTNKQIYFLY